jgi:hypothetical protein
VVRVVPRLDRNARVAEEVRVVRDRRGSSVARKRDDVAVHVEHLPAGVVRIARLRSADVRARGIDVSMPCTRASRPTATDAVSAAGEFRVAGDRPVRGTVELNPSPEAAEVVPARRRGCCS